MLDYVTLLLNICIRRVNLKVIVRHLVCGIESGKCKHHFGMFDDISCAWRGKSQQFFIELLIIVIGFLTESLCPETCDYFIDKSLEIGPRIHIYDLSYENL